MPIHFFCVLAKGYASYFQKHDDELVNAMTNLDIDSMGSNAAKTEFYKTVSRPLRGACQTMRMVGGAWVEPTSYVGGGWD